MTRQRSRLLFAGIITFIVGLIIFFPARVAYRWVATPELQLSGLKGSVWYGGAREASGGGIYVRDLHWRLKPLAIFTGKLGYAIKASPPSGFVDADVAIGLGGAVSITNLDAAIPLQLFERPLSVSGLRGSATVRLDRLRIEDGIPVEADGFLEVANLKVPIIDPGSLGGYRAEIFTQDSGVGASVEDTDGVIDLAGSLQLSADRSYQFIAQLAPKPGAAAGVRRQLQFLGSANDRGQHELRLEGQL